MKRHFLYASLWIAFVGMDGLAQAPRVAPLSDPNAAPAAPLPDGLGAKAPMRRQLAAPLHNQFDPLRRQPIPEQELKADIVTPEMWLYMQEMRRYDDPLNAVRANAATRASHRRSRIAAMQWFGFSNTRPQASPMPFTDMYSPTWMSNSWNPYGWIGTGHAWNSVRVEPIVITR